MEGRYRNITILHSNDLHGDFLSANVDENLLGGISMLSGYVNEVRSKKPTIYCIAGDMLQGSLIDTEFKGISTIEIMNLLNPDIVSLGNHEIDYGLSHLLFLERCAKFPIVNANFFIKNPYTRLFNSHKILKVGDTKILFIGIITQEVMSSIKLDNLLGTLVDVEDAALEVGRICNAYRAIDIDFTVLLTHIGFEEDKKLAAMLNPEWGVDLIIGGHSHTILEQPAMVNDILIAQAGVGTSQIGHFDLVIDADTNSLHSYEWKLVPITSKYCPRDEVLENIISRYKEQTDEKYERILCKFARPLSHPDRYQETELGNLLSDILKNALGVDVMLLGSGSIRKERVETIFTFGNLVELLPYDDRILSMKANFRQLKQMIKFMLESTKDGEHGEFYQISHGLGITYDLKSGEFTRFTYNGVEVDDEDVISFALQDYHYKNFANFFGFPREDLIKGSGIVVTTSLLDIISEYFTVTNNIDAKIDNRLVIIK